MQAPGFVYRFARKDVRETINKARAFFLFSIASSFWYKPQRRDGFAYPPTEQETKMEKSESSAESGDLPLTRTLWRTRTLLPVPEDFVPLRLILQPSGAAVEFTQPDILLGRHSQADVRLPLPDVSRRHCRFFFGQGVWQVLDLNSLNGVFVNGEPVRQATLRQGDLIRIGGFIFAVDVNGADTQAAESEASARLIRGLFNRSPDTELHRRAS